MFVIPAEAGIAGGKRALQIAAAPACGVPAKYYFAGCPGAGATVL
jgi:hypothetical protein